MDEQKIVLILATKLSRKIKMIGTISLIKCYHSLQPVSYF